MDIVVVSALVHDVDFVYHYYYSVKLGVSSIQVSDVLVMFLFKGWVFVVC